MAEIFLILLVVGYLIYRVAFGIPKDIKKNEDKIHMLELHLKEIKFMLNEINRKLDNK